MKRKRNPKTKALFLDFDGVIVLGTEDSDYEYFSPSCVEILNEIIIETDCEIIVSSDWRLHYDLQTLKQMFRDEGIIKTPIAVTPDLYDRKMNMSELEALRAKEILTWLKDHPVDLWVAVDDMDLPLKNFVQTDDKKGLITRGIKRKIIEFLT